MLAKSLTNLSAFSFCTPPNALAVLSTSLSASIGSAALGSSACGNSSPTFLPNKSSTAFTNSGSVFLGNYTPESAGDYASGTNHTLPTNGYAKAYSGVNLDSFVRKVTFQQITKEGLTNLSNAIILMAENEELQAHSNAVKVRLDEEVPVETRESSHRR